jgi:cyanophycinase-like exopeptidase
MGGGPTVDSAFVWMHDTITGEHGARGGDVVVLTASEGDVYTDYLMKVAPFNSVRSISIGPGATPSDLARAAAYVDRAQGLFFTGGDQAHYVKWKGSPLIASVQRLYDRGGVVGGTSAGLAILGEYVYDSVAADAMG